MSYWKPIVRESYLTICMNAEWMLNDKRKLESFMKLGCQLSMTITKVVQECTEMSFLVVYSVWLNKMYLY